MPEGFSFFVAKHFYIFTFTFTIIQARSLYEAYVLGSVSVLTRCYCSVFNVHTPVLKALRFGAVTREAGKAFHCSRVLGKKLLPRITDLLAAPESLLQMIRGNCSSDCARAWCTSRKHGLECSPACGQCRGTACTTSSIQFDEDGSRRVTWKWKQESQNNLSTLWNLIRQYCKSILHFWKHMFLICMFENESGLVAAYCWAITKCHSLCLGKRNEILYVLE